MSLVIRPLKTIGYNGYNLKDSSKCVVIFSYYESQCGTPIKFVPNLADRVSVREGHMVNLH